MSLDEEFTLDDLIKLSQKDYISFDIKKSDFFPDEFLVYTMLKSNKKLKQGRIQTWGATVSKAIW